jgi:hypothetical protein
MQEICQVAKMFKPFEKILTLLTPPPPPPPPPPIDKNFGTLAWECKMRKSRANFFQIPPVRL